MLAALFFGRSSVGEGRDLVAEGVDIFLKWTRPCRIPSSSAYLEESFYLEGDVFQQSVFEHGLKFLIYF